MSPALLQRAVLFTLVGTLALTGCRGATDAAGPGTSSETASTQASSTTAVTSSPATVASSTTTLPATTTAPPTTTSPPSTTTTTVPAPVALRRGDEGPSVAAVQQQLAALGYWVGPIDGKYGHQTAQAVMAFQKVEGYERDGVMGTLTQIALDAATRPLPGRVAGDGVEIDLTRQVLFIVRDGAVAETHNTSTGRAGWRTRAGTFTVFRQIDGMRNAPLGQLWRPKYFDGGIAMHGSTSIPSYPASHGCARLSNAAINHLWADGLVPIGTTVVVYA